MLWSDVTDSIGLLSFAQEQRSPSAQLHAFFFHTYRLDSLIRRMQDQINVAQQLFGSGQDSAHYVTQSTIVRGPGLIARQEDDALAGQKVVHEGPNFHCQIFK
jgi:hypothetical protein